MHVEHHDLHHDFPEYLDYIDALKTSSEQFGHLYDEYHRLTREVERLEEEDLPVDDFTIENMKKQRVWLKDQMYRMLVAFQERRADRLIAFLPAAQVHPVEWPDAYAALLAPLRLLLFLFRLHRRFFALFRALSPVAVVLGLGHRPADVADAVDAPAWRPMSGARWPIDSDSE
jgi:uncharacterized protein YdcH (DUF465 family)